MKKKKSKKDTFLKPSLDFKGGLTYPPIEQFGVFDPMGTYTGYPIVIDFPEQDADDL